MNFILLVNGHVWQSRRQRELASSWLLISRPNNAKCANGKVVALGVGEPPAERRRLNLVLTPGVLSILPFSATASISTVNRHRVNPDFIREASEVIDLAGAIVLPGLQDAHIHISCMGESAHFVDLSSCQSVPEVQQAVRQHAERKPHLPWVIGTGWDQNLWSPPMSLTRFDLDAALPNDRPCMLYRRCWHAIAANTVAMRAAGVDPDQVWPPPPLPPTSGGDDLDSGGGTTSQYDEEKAGGFAEVEGVEVDDSQHPTGLFREESMKLVESAVTAPSFETRCEQYAEALARCVRSGLTAVQTNDDNAVRVYERLQNEGRLPIRVYLTLPHDELEEQASTESKATVEGETTEIRATNEHLFPEAGDSGHVEGDDGKDGSRAPWAGGEGLLSWHRVKLFADGSLGAETAAMRIPYVGTTNTGILIHDRETLTRKVALAKDRGFRVEVHAIGDRALAAVLDAFERAGLTAADRPIVTHCQVVGQDLVSRMEILGAVAAVQPSFVPSDAPVVMKRLSPEVHPSCYPWRTLMHSGVTCAGGSDSPIETQDPLRGIYDAVLRPNKPTSTAVPQSGPNVFDVDPFLPDERLTLEEAVWMYSAGGAFAAGMEDRVGVIKEGFMADLTILEVDGGVEALLESPRLILEAKVFQVWVGGWRRWIAPADGAGLSNGDRERAAASRGSLSGSGLPGKNGPKRKQGGDNNPWLSRGPGRIGRCRCCS